MTTLPKLLLFCAAFTVSGNLLAYTEIPFCPGGGPPGWMNYFDYKRNQNNRQQQLQTNSYYPPAQYYTDRYRQPIPGPTYRGPRYNDPRQRPAPLHRMQPRRNDRSQY